jgi:serine O-acetyltransferase
MIGADTVVLHGIEDGCTVVGSQGRVVRKGDGKNKNPAIDLDQIHTPDPMAQEICKLIIRIEKLEKELEKYKNSSTEG